MSRSIKDAYLLGRDHLRAAGVQEDAIQAEMLLRLALRVDRARLYTHWDGPMPEAAWDRYRELLEERAAGVPVHYLVGEREFMGLMFAVDERVLIPRPETELLVEHVAQWAREERAGLIVDVGTGSGCIAVSLAHLLPQATVYATDLSPAALEVARANAVRHGVQDRVILLAGDLLTPLPPDVAGRLDAVVSNPPYVPQDQASALAREIREHEPPEALFAPGDGTAVHRRLLALGPNWLRPGGLLAMEVGAGQAPAVAEAVRLDGRYGPPTILPDGVGIERVVAAVLAGAEGESAGART